MPATTAEPSPPITSEWWHSVTAGEHLWSLSEDFHVAAIGDRLRLYALTDDDQTLTLLLPAVRTQSDARDLCRLLGNLLPEPVA